MNANTPGQPPAGPVTVSSRMPTPSSALAIGAHPDDVEFGAGATLSAWARQGCVVHHLICTDGSKGTWDPQADLDALRRVRRDEQRAASVALAGDAAGSVFFLDYVDGELASGIDERRRVAEVIRRVRPAVVLGHDPWKRYRLHPDHRHAGLLACDGIVAARDPHFFADLGLALHRPEALLLFEADEINHLEPADEADIDRKLAALHAHASQFESTMHATDDAGLVAFDRRIREALESLGAAHGMAAAEAFHLMTDL